MRLVFEEWTANVEPISSGVSSATIVITFARRVVTFAELLLSLGDVTVAPKSAVIVLVLSAL